MNVQCNVGYRVCSGTTGIDWSKSCDIERVEDAGGAFNIGGNQTGGVDRRKGYIYSSSCNLIHILHFVG
jgi:hypothetical protein